MSPEEEEEEEEDDTDGCEEDEGGGTPSPDTIAKAPASLPAKQCRLDASVTSKIVARKTFILFFFSPSSSFAEYFHCSDAPQLANPAVASSKKKKKHMQASKQVGAV